MGERQELERFCAETYPRLVGALTHHVGDRWLAEEFAQEALVRACDRWSQVRRMRSPAGWAFRVGANLASSHFRRKRAERRAHARHGGAPSVHRDPETPDQIAVREALDTLTEKQREAVILRYFLGLSVAETAEVTGGSEVGVRGLTHRAIGGLRDVLAPSDADEEVADVR